MDSAQFVTGHRKQCLCSWCKALENVVVVEASSSAAPTPRPKTALLEPKNFVRIPMIEG